MLTATAEPDTDLVRVGHCSTEPGMIESAFPRPTPVEAVMITRSSGLAEISHSPAVDDDSHDCGPESSDSLACRNRGAYRLARVNLVETPIAIDQQ